MNHNVLDVDGLPPRAGWRFYRLFLAQALRGPFLALAMVIARQLDTTTGDDGAQATQSFVVLPHGHDGLFRLFQASCLLELNILVGLVNKGGAQRGGGRGGGGGGGWKSAYF